MDDGTLIFGHNYGYDEQEGKDYFGINSDDIENEYEESVRDFKLICHIGQLLKKDVQGNIEKHRDFESHIKDVDNVIIVGHSMGKPDMPYFEWIKSIVPNQTRWIISYYKNPHESEAKLKELGIEDYEVKTISEILDRFLF